MQLQKSQGWGHLQRHGSAVGANEHSFPVGLTISAVSPQDLQKHRTVRARMRR